MKIDELDLSVRAYNCLFRAGVDTVEKLRELSDDDLFRIRNISQKNIEEIRERLAKLRITNADRIQVMSIEEKAKYFRCPRDLNSNFVCLDKSCEECVIKWLKQPAE